MQVRGLPRLPQDRKEYTQEEIDSAGFTFSRWTVRGTVIDLHIQMDVGVNRDFDECGFGMDNIHKNTDAFFSYKKLTVLAGLSIEKYEKSGFSFGCNFWGLGRDIAGLTSLDILRKIC